MGMYKFQKITLKLITKLIKKDNFGFLTNYLQMKHEFEVCWEYLDHFLKTCSCDPSIGIIFDNIVVGQSVEYIIGQFNYTAHKRDQYHVIQINNNTNECKVLRSNV